jgi:hypothetical protein
LAPRKYVPASRSTSVRFGGNLTQPADDRSWPGPPNSACPMSILSLVAMRHIPDLRQSPRPLPARLRTRRRVAVTDNTCAFATHSGQSGQRESGRAYRLPDSFSDHELPEHRGRNSGSYRWHSLRARCPSLRQPSEIDLSAPDPNRKFIIANGHAPAPIFRN